MKKKVWWGIAAFAVLSVIAALSDPPEPSKDQKLEKTDYPKNMDQSSAIFEFYSGTIEEAVSPLKLKIYLETKESILVHIPLVKVPESDQPLGKEVLKFAQKYKGQAIRFYPVYRIKKGEYIGHIAFIKDTYGEELIENGYAVLHKEGKYDPIRVPEYLENQQSAQKAKKGVNANLIIDHLVVQRSKKS
ncbi:thermonuclease family protein [Paenactinomyces guangxiensis]|uniref:Thermonuclease family protein n=1 Tax=Paenactinomyces guangxiensis TaxID=1490290 RepID=A0A7W1WQR8_9BACL|nr:thermonuclease family protein [Paenactinomyces guangxiensis]MBA4494349.1 thermonuclease family protein [Paenactinomyces guangxiensis]MBH8590844.1 thermonuclease family protein [Paenactinomyces guangxiensis]